MSVKWRTNEKLHTLLSLAFNKTKTLQKKWSIWISCSSTLIFYCSSSHHRSQQYPNHITLPLLCGYELKCKNTKRFSSIFPQSLNRCEFLSNTLSGSVAFKPSPNNWPLYQPQPVIQPIKILYENKEEIFVSHQKSLIITHMNISNMITIR